MWCCKAKPTEHKDENEANKSRRFQATKCFPSTKCLPNCLILGKKTAGKDKFKGDGKYTGHVTSKPGLHANNKVVYKVLLFPIWKSSITRQLIVGPLGFTCWISFAAVFSLFTVEFLSLLYLLVIS